MNSFVTLVVRRARRDATLLAGSVVLTAAATLLTIVGPTLVLQAIDGGAQQEIRAAGPRGDLVFETSLGTEETLRGAPPGLASSDDAQVIVDGLDTNLPPALARVVTGSTLTVLGPEAVFVSRGGETLERDAAPRVRFALLTERNASEVRVAEGELPADPEGRVIPVALSAASADAAGLAVGSEFEIAITNWRGGVGADSAKLQLRVASIVEAAATGSDAWQDTPELWEPLDREATSTEPAHFRFTVLASPASIERVVESADDPFRVIVRAEVDAAELRTEHSDEIISDVDALEVNPQPVAGTTGANLGIETDLEVLLRGYEIQARAALAQMSVLMSSVIGIASVVLFLLSGLLVAQRSGAIALERARGSSVVFVGLRLALESVVLAVVGVVVGTVVALLVFGGVRDILPVVVIALVAALATPTLGMAFASRVWSGKRAPANRKDRQRIVARARARRAVIELSVIALATAAVLSLRGRGLLTTRADGIDPFLAAAPLLFAVAVTVVVVRLYPGPVRALTALGGRSRGVLGVLGAVRARSSIATLPLLALTLGVALTVGGGLLVETARGGQVEASWERVGAEMRVDGPVTEQDVATIRDADGVTAVGAGRIRQGVGIDFGTSSRSFTVVAIDEGWAGVVAGLPDQKGAESLRALGAVGPDERLPVLVDKQTEKTLITNDLTMFYGPKGVPLEVVGTTNYSPTGYADGPFVFVNFESLSDRMPEPLEATTVLVMGEGAADAATDSSLPPSQVIARSAWLEARRDSALVAGVERTMLFSVGAVALLATLALIATVASGARSRGRDLALLRTLGMRPRLGWWLALAELLPLVIAAVVGGLAAGVGVVLFLAPTLGLEVLAGGSRVPHPVLSPVIVFGLAAATILLLLAGALVDVLVHRGDKLSSVLRVGETV